MITPEQLINDLQEENAKLKEELEIVKGDSKWFENTAFIWKKAYDDNEFCLQTLLKNQELVIEELEKDLEAAKFEILHLKS